jgi:hypothetical protein
MKGSVVIGLRKDRSQAIAKSKSLSLNHCKGGTALHGKSGISCSVKIKSRRNVKIIAGLKLDKNQTRGNFREGMSL